MRATTIAAALTLCLLTAPALAQSRGGCEDEPRETKPGDKTKKKNYKTVIGPDGKKIFVIEKAFVVCGKIPRPTVIYAFQPSTINYEWESLKKDFIPLILATVKEAPF